MQFISTDLIFENRFCSIIMLLLMFKENKNEQDEPKESILSASKNSEKKPCKIHNPVDTQMALNNFVCTSLVIIVIHSIAYLLFFQLE